MESAPPGIFFQCPTIFDGIIVILIVAVCGYTKDSEKSNLAFVDDGDKAKDNKEYDSCHLKCSN